MSETVARYHHMVKKILLIHTDPSFTEFTYGRLIHKPGPFHYTFLPVEKLISSQKRARRNYQAIIVDCHSGGTVQLRTAKTAFAALPAVPLVFLIELNDYLTLKPLFPDATFIIKDPDENFLHQLPLVLDNLISENALQLRLKYALFNKHRELLADTMFDDLTECYNQRFIAKLIGSEVSRNHPFTLLTVSLKNWRALTHAAGHFGFSELIRVLATEIRRVMRQSDLLARTGVGELTVVMPSTPKTKAVALERRVQKSIEALTLRDENRGRDFKPQIEQNLIDNTQPEKIRRFLARTTAFTEQELSW